MLPRLDGLKMGLLFFALSIGVCCSLALLFSLHKSPAQSLASPFVMISDGGGHGSGTHIGGGVFLTAFHVTDGATKFKIKTNDGRELDGIRLLQSDIADVALVYVEAYEGVATAPLSCDPNYIGQQITITGNPERVAFAKTWGRVSALGDTGYESMLQGRWKELVTLDATAAHGVSGAGVINSAGQVVGILVSGLETNGSVYPYTFMIPGHTICHALGRS